LSRHLGGAHSRVRYGELGDSAGVIGAAALHIAPTGPAGP